MTVVDADDRPAPAPVVVRDVRAELAGELLRGSGLEIGALHLPMSLPAGARVRYVDRMTVPELRAHYPELAEAALAPVDIVDDGERLATIAQESVDFIIANHFLEHCEDPIRTLETHLGKLRPGGVLFYAVPDKRYTFDFRRPRTPLEHIIADHEHGPERSRSEHYLEWVRLVYPEGGPPPEEDQARQGAAHLEATSYSIHYHVWTQADLLELVLHCQQRFGNFDIEAVRSQGLENIVVLRKHGEPPPPAASPTPQPAPPQARTQAVKEQRIALSALPETVDDGAAAARWAVEFEGVPGRALLLPAGNTLSIPLRLERPVRLLASVVLVPRDWRDGDGRLRTWAAVAGPTGQRHEAWSATLASAAARGKPDPVAVDCELPAWTQTLLIGVDRHAAQSGSSVGRAMWLEAKIVDPAAPVIETSPPAGAEPRQPPPERHDPDRPLISVLTPVHDPPLAMLEQAIASVRGQSFPNWELCLVDDGSQDPAVTQALRRHAAEDPRIHLARREHAGGIATATNTALELATGEYIALLDHDDTLDPHALELFARQLDAQPDLDMVYSDEDVVTDERRIAAHLKPGWSPEAFASMMYTCHLGVYRRSLAQELGGFRSEFDGCQDYDFVLRLIERSNRVGHIPRVLYHWRAHSHSTAGAGDAAKPQAYVRQRRAITEHLDRSGIAADVEFGTFLGLHRIVHRVDPSLTVALVLAVQDDQATGPALTEAARSWLAQPHPAWEVVVGGPPEALPATIATLHAAGVPQSRIVTVPSEAGDRTAVLSAAGRAARAEHLILMQSPVTGLTHDWLRRLLGYSSQPGIGAAGPLVLAPNGYIIEAGVAVPGGTPLHLLHGREGAAGTATVMNLSAVSGVLATPRTTFQALDGLRVQMGDRALIDYCLRIRELDQRVVVVPDARVQSPVASLTSNDLGRLWRLRQTWEAEFAEDPYYNRHYRSDRGDSIPASEP